MRTRESNVKFLPFFSMPFTSATQYLRLTYFDRITTFKEKKDREQVLFHVRLSAYMRT